MYAATTTSRPPEASSDVPAPASAEPLRSKASRTKFEPTSDAMAQYMSQLESLPLLNAAQELALAREIEALEIAHWRALLSYKPALDVVVAAVVPCLPGRARKLEALRKQAETGRGRRTKAKPSRMSLTPAIAASAQELRKLDVERSAVAAAGQAVRTSFAEDLRARGYLSRVEAARRAQQEAKDRFVLANLRLVINMARRVDRSLMPLNDLIQEGNLGLIRAVERFDYRRGFRFSTYAAWWIRHNLNRGLSDKARLVRIPVHTLDSLSRVARASVRATIQTGTAPTLEELAVQTGLSEERLGQLRVEAGARHPVSMDASLSAEREQTLHEILPSTEPTDPDQALDVANWQEELKGLMHELQPIEAAILRFRFGLEDGEELTLREIGRKYNLSRERIRQLQEAALGKLRRTLTHRMRPGDLQSGAAA